MVGEKGDAGQLWILAVCRGTPKQINNYVYKISFLALRGTFTKRILRGEKCRY